MHFCRVRQTRVQERMVVNTLVRTFGAMVLHDSTAILAVLLGEMVTLDVEDLRRRGCEVCLGAEYRRGRSGKL